MSGEVLIDVGGNSAKRVAEFDLAKKVSEILVKHYPNFAWAVTVNDGLIQIHNLNLSGRWGFVVKEDDVYSATDLDRRLMQAGGELLERYKISRARMSQERAQSKLMALPTDFAGRLSFDK